MSGVSNWDHQAVTAIIDNLKNKPGALMPILHGIQDSQSFVPEGAVSQIADALKLSRAEVHGVISFYHHFRTTPPGRHQLQICRAEACQSMGSRELEAHAKQRLGIDYHGTTADGEISLDPVYCLGNCACSPSIRVGDEIMGRMSPDKLDQLIDNLTTNPVEVKKA